LPQFARWICALPIAVKRFLRPSKRRGWQQAERLNKQRFELGALLAADEVERLLSEDVCAPIFVLNRLRQLAARAAAGTAEPTAEPHVRAAYARQLNEQIDVLTGAWGAMERINATPLPFVYVVHLRTFLLLYLLLWSTVALAEYGVLALPCLLMASWALLGIEAASVECERPFRWEANHLPFGRIAITVSRHVAQTLCDFDSAGTADC